MTSPHGGPPNVTIGQPVGVKITGPLLAALDRDDVETTIRTLQEITRRARGIPVRRTTTEESS